MSLMHISSSVLSLGAWEILTLLFIALSLNYVVSLWQFKKIRKAHERGDITPPPRLPAIVPWFGSAFAFAWDPSALINRAIDARSEQNPVLLKLGPQDMYVVQGSRNLKALWKKSGGMSANGTFYYTLRHVFGMAAKPSQHYLLDDSGTSAHPLPESNVAPNNRVGYLNHQLFNQLLLGPGFSPLWASFEKGLARFINTQSSMTGWTENADFLEVFTLDLMKVSLEALCGPILLQLDPDFPRRFWEYSNGLPHFLRRLPRFLVPKSYRIRDSLIQSVKNWHRAAKQKSAEKPHMDGDTDPFWGTEFFRRRQEVLQQVDDYDEDAIAVEDFAALWGFHHNVILAAFWVSFEVFRDPNLLARVRAEIATCKGGEGPTPFDVKKLIKSPLLQSIFTETLRLRVHIYNSRCTGNGDVQVNNWFIPKKSVVFVSSTPAHMEATEWNTGRNNEHPLDSFWADRFVVYPNDPFSGPNKRTSESKVPASEGPHFQLDSSMAGRFIPFGGGAYTCPGRHFAKREVLLTCAMLVSSLDVEILASDDAAKMDWTTCGFGTLKPAGKIAYRVRKRNASPLTHW